MALRKIETVVGSAVHVPGEDIDTDRIIPARFLKRVTFDGLGEQLFYDARFARDGSKTGHPLDDPRYAGATVLIAAGDYAEADRLRAEIEAAGWDVRDDPGTYRLVPRS